MTAGPGPDGPGLRKEIWYLEGQGYFPNRSDARKSPPEGGPGGLPDASSCRRLVRADGAVDELSSKQTNIWIEAGDLMVLETAGDGGWGDPMLHDPRAVLTDYLDGKIRAATVLRDHGIVLCPDGRQVETEATAERRGKEHDGSSA